MLFEKNIYIFEKNIYILKLPFSFRYRSLV